MAKHDQRILKFLNQNSDRSPTITEMMTRLNISISDISDSLGSLQAQGLISKKTNGQGIECWFPTASHAAQPIPAAAMQDRGQQSSSYMMPQTLPNSQATQQIAIMGNSVASDSRHGGEVYSGMDSRFLGVMPERTMAAPEPLPPMPKGAPVQVQHVAESGYGYDRGIDSSAHNPIEDYPTRPAKPEVPVFNPNAFGLAPARTGVGLLTLCAGLIAAVALSAFLSSRMVAKEVKKASAGFVDRKALEAAKAELTQFDEKTKAHVQALEDDVKKLTAELALSKANAESLKVATAAKPEAPKAEAKAKAKKPALVAKAKSGSTSAIAKAAARGAAMRKKAKLAAASRDSESDYGSSESSMSESSRGVPEPPGLEELPSPPAE